MKPRYDAMYDAYGESIEALKRSGVANNEIAQPILGPTNARAPGRRRVSDFAPIGRSESPSASRRGRFDDFGGQYVAPILIPVLDRLDDAFVGAWSDVSFRQAFETILHRFVGRPTPLFQASRLAGRVPSPASC